MPLFTFSESILKDFFKIEKATLSFSLVKPQQHNNTAEKQPKTINNRPFYGQ
jgi:hypothetical protein